MKPVLISALAFSIGLVSGCANSPEGQAIQAQAADTIFVDAKVYTVNEQQPWAQAVAVKAGKIVYVGSNEGANALIGQHTQVTDLDGKMLLPGFIDTHAHPTMAAMLSDSLELNFNDDEAALLKQIKEYVDDNPDKPGYTGMGFYAANFKNGLPHKTQLDAIESNKPIVLLDSGGHTAWVNSKALELAGIDKNTPDPIPGSHFYQRDEKGNPTGYCLESQSFLPMLAPFAKVDEIVESAPEVLWLMNSAGITTVFDAGMAGFEQQGFSAFQALEKKGELPLRLVGSYMVQNPNVVPIAISEIKRLNKEFASDLISPSVIKIHNDGTKEALTAAMSEDYSNDKGNKGTTLLGPKALTDFVKDINQAGIDIHIHAIGDQAISEALDAFEAARLDAPSQGNRFSIAHNEFMEDRDLKRFAALDVVAQTTPIWFASGADEMVQKIMGNTRADKLNRFKSVELAGGTLSFGSDFPTESLAGVFPTYNMEVGMTRQYVGEPNSKIAQPESERLSLKSMIKGYTLNAAYQLNMETEIGSIEVGKKADLVVLQDNLFEVDVYDIHGVRVDSSYVDGKQVYARNWQSWLAELVLDI